MDPGVLDGWLLCASAFAHPCASMLRGCVSFLSWKKNAKTLMLDLKSVLVRAGHVGRASQHMNHKGRREA